MMPSQIYLNSKINQDEEEHSKGGREGGEIQPSNLTSLTLWCHTLPSNVTECHAAII